MDFIDKLKICLQPRQEVVAAYLFGSTVVKAPIMNDMDILVLLRDDVDPLEIYIELKSSLADATGLSESKIDLLLFDLNHANPKVLIRAINSGLLIKNSKPNFLGKKIEALSKYFLENEPIIRRANFLKSEQLRVLHATR